MNAIVNMADFVASNPLLASAVRILKFGDQQVFVLKAQPTASDLHVNALLTNISVAYMQDAAAFIAGRAFPSLPVVKQSDRYTVYDRGFWVRSEMKQRGLSSESAGIGYKTDTTPTYYCPVYALHHDIDDQVRANADSVFALDNTATMLLTHQSLLKRELEWISKYFTTGIWSYDRTGVAAAPGANQFLQWNDAASTPIEDVRLYKRTIRENTGIEANKFVMGRGVYDVLVDHPDIVDRVKYGGQAPSGGGNPARVSKQALEALFEVDEILVANAIQNTAAEGQTASYSFVAGKHALLCHSAPVPGLLTPTAGYTFNWTGYMGAGASGGRILRFRMDHLKSDRVEIEDAFDMKLVAADLGLYMASAVA
jgi:hypothetical protein